MWNYFEILQLATEMVFKGFSIFNSGDHFVQQSRTILAILVKGDKRNISVKSLLIRPLAKNMFKGSFFLILALAAILFSRAELFSNFGKGP